MLIDSLALAIQPTLILKAMFVLIKVFAAFTPFYFTAYLRAQEDSTISVHAHRTSVLQDSIGLQMHVSNAPDYLILPTTLENSYTFDGGLVTV